MEKASSIIKEIFTFRWKPNKDLAAIGVSWLLVVGCLYTATKIVGTQAGGGMFYFFLYAVLGATLCGLGIPLYWTVAVRKRPIADLGITTRLLGISLLIQLVLSVLQYSGVLRGLNYPPRENLIPLLALALAIGFFEAIFWRGWVQLRLEGAFGILPGIVLASVLYAAYHIGYGMPLSEMVFLFFVGMLFAIVFRLTKNIFILWPLFQPLGQLITLVNDGLELPLLAALGFIEVLVLMFVLVWLAWRYYRKHQGPISEESKTLAASRAEV